jgi:hypothetical protein
MSLESERLILTLLAARDCLRSIKITAKSPVKVFRSSLEIYMGHKLTTLQVYHSCFSFSLSWAT